MKTFLQQVSDELLRRFGWEGLKDLTLVFPMHRAGVVMRYELQQRMAADHPGSVWAPEMISLGDLFDNLCPLGKEDELFTVCRLHRIYSECLQEQPMDIDRFYSWGRQLLSDFTNIDQGISETEIESFFRNAMTLADLDTYKLDDDVRHRLEDLLYKGEARQQSFIAQSVQAHFAALWKAMPTIYHRLRDELQQVGKGYEGQRMRYVVSHWQQTRVRATGSMYCFIGFNYLLPVERQLMQRLNEEGRALFFWDYVEDFRANSKAFAFIRQNMRLLPNALPSVKWGAPRSIRTISAVSTHSEAEYAGQWLQQTYIRKGEPTAVVICDEAQLEPVIYGIPPIVTDASQEPEEINITKGYPLRNTSVFAEVINQLERKLSKPADDYVPVLKELVTFVDEQSAQSIAARQQTWQWHLQREALYQTRRTLIQFIHILQEEIVSSIASHPDLLRRLICRHLEQISLPFHGEPVTDLQIMGVLETRTLDFKHLLLLNVEEGVIPAHQPDKSFLPYYLRKAYGLQTHDERASVYAYNFFRLLNRAEDVTILFSQSQTAMTKKVMSRFIMQMLICPEEFQVDKFTLTESNTLHPARTVEVPEDAGWADMCLQAGKSLYLSPSAINTFYACKRKFYLEYMIGLREDDEQEAIFSNRTLGLFVHEAIHYLYKHYCHCSNEGDVRIYPNQVDAINTPERRQQAILKAYERLNDRYMRDNEVTKPVYFPEQHELENRVIDAYVTHILDRDRYDAEHCGLTILLLEEPLFSTITVTLPADEGCEPTEMKVSIGGRVDRMDRIGGNGMTEVTRIVDYKCGKYDQKKMKAEAKNLHTPEVSDTDYLRQTLLYSYVTYMQHKPGVSVIEPHLYFTSQNLTSERARTRVELDGTPVTYDSSNHAQFTTLIQTMVADVLNEHQFPQCKQCSPYCPFLQLCGRKASKF